MNPSGPSSHRSNSLPAWHRIQAAAAIFLGVVFAASPALPAQTVASQQITVAGLRASGQQGQFNAVRSDSFGNLFLLLDEKDGVRLLKTDSTAMNVLAQALLGAAGDVGLAMALDPAGNVYVTGTTSSGSLTATSGAAFPNTVGTGVNAFIAKFDPSLNLDFVTFGGSDRTASTAIAATADAVFITGLIYGNGLPATPSGIIQQPAFHSNQNGFVERFSNTGSTLVYATYLSGAEGDTSPIAIAADTGDNAYIGGFTTATGFPTIAALIPRTTAATTGFLIKLTPAADGITFSTYIPGSGIASIAIDPATGNLLLTGGVALGQFPVASVAAPLVSTPYQVLLRMPADGSSVLSSTVLAPGTQSSVAPGPGGTVWVDGTLSTPLLPIQTAAAVGTGFAMRVSPASAPGGTVIDLAARFGGLPAANANFASLPLILNSVTVDAAGSAVFVGSVAPTASANHLASQTFDLPLTVAPTAALPSSVHDAVLPVGSCDGSLCAGTAAYLARLKPAAGPSLAFSTDASPSIVLRNLGSVEATGLQIAATGFTQSNTCGGTLPIGGECTVLLGGSGPGNLTAQASNSPAQTVNLPALPPGTAPNPIVFSPRELDFGVQSGNSPPATRTVTVTNLGQTDQTFASALDGNPRFIAFAVTEDPSTDCALGAQPNTKTLPAGASCHITLGFSASSDPSKDGPARANWSIGSGDVLLTGFGQAEALNLSTSIVDFGTQFHGGLTSPRFLYLSNNSSAVLTHTPLTISADLPFTLTDRCPAQLSPHTVCQIQLGYLSPVSTSSDSTSLSLDGGLSVLVTGETTPQPGVGGQSTPPTLNVSPSTMNFPAAVAVTGTSSGTQTVTVQNTGSSAFALALSLTGDFTDQTNCGATLAAGNSCTVLITFAPSQPGARTGLLAVTAGSNTTPLYVNLSGTGTPILPANNGTLDFGSVPLGQPTVQWYKVSQAFTSFTASTGSPVFHAVLVEDIGYGHGQLPPSSFLAATTGSCVNCWLGVEFTPNAAGPVAATLTLSSSTAGIPYTLSLTGNGFALSNLVLTPANRDFGTVPIGSSGAPVLFTLTNLSSATATVTPPTFTGDFALSSAPSGGPACSGSLAPNASCFVEAFFAPTAPGQRTGALTIQTNAGASTASFTGFGAPDPGIAFNPNALIFANVPGPTATQQTITVSNTSSGPLVVGAITNANAAFTSTTTCATLAPAATCTVTVTYLPGSATVTDALQVPVTATVGGNPVLTTYTVALAGTYTAQTAGLQIIPLQTNFGPAAVNTLGGTRQFTINNLTAKSLAIDLTLPRQFVLQGAPCAGLAPNASCTFSVGFLPITNGDITGTLFAQGIPTDGSATLDGLGFLQGYGIGTTSLSITGNISPGRILNFGQVPSGQSAQQILTLTNTTPAGAASTTVTVHRVTSQWPFLSTTNCGAPLAIGASCTVTLNYTPLNQVASGSASPPANTNTGVLTVESDASSAPDLIDLSGTATAAAVSAPSNTAPLIGFSASQSSLTFPVTPIGFSSPPQYVTLSNTGTTTLHVKGLAASPDFSVAGSCASLLPGASCQLTIIFAPQVSTVPAGPRTGAVEIASDSTTSLEFLSLLGTASPSILVFQPAALNFGVLLVGNTATLPIKITNAGNTAAVFSAITTAGDYAASGDCPTPGNSLAPNGSCTVQVAFTPTTTGLRPGSLSIASSVSTTPLTATLTGSGAQSLLRINPTSLNFGNVTVGTNASLSLTLANTGTAAIAAVKFSVTGDYAVIQPCSFTTLSAGASCSVTVAFSPTAAGARPGILTISSSDPTSPNTVALAGTGISGSPTNNASFTLTVNGSNAATQSVAQTRPATYTLTVTPLSGFTGNVALGCNAITAAPYATCSMLPSSVTLTGGTSQTAIVTINTITSASLRGPILKSLNQTAMCLLAPTALLFWRFRKTLNKRPASLFLAMVYATMMILASGCGGGGNPNLRITPPGTYQYTVTGSSTTGTPVSQTVTLNLSIP